MRFMSSEEVGDGVGSRSGWRIAMPLAAALQNSHQDGGRVFLNFGADPRTARLCNSDRFGSTGRRLGDRVRGEAVGAEGRCPLPVLPSTDWSSTGGRFRSRCACEA
jgi:hypothetical protein